MMETQNTPCSRGATAARSAPDVQERLILNENRAALEALLRTPGALPALLALAREPGGLEALLGLARAQRQWCERI